MTEQNLNDEGELIMSDNERLDLLGMDDPRMAACFGIDRVVTEGTIVKIKSSIVIPHLMSNYDEYQMMTESDKRLFEESGNLNLIPHEVPEWMYGVITAEHYEPPNMHRPEKYMVDWAGEYHLKLFDHTKSTDDLFLTEDLVGVKWPDNRVFRENEEMLSKSFKYNEEYMEWERKEFRFKCWYCDEEGCDRMILWDRLSLVYSDLTNNVTISNNQRRYTVYQAMLLWSQNLMGRIALREICICVVREVGELFPSDTDESETDEDSGGTIDLLE